MAKTYESYKDSGVAWIGEIPSEWKVSRYKFYTTNRMGETILASDTTDVGIPIYSATQDDSIFGYIQNPKVILKKGDIVIPARGNSIGYATQIKDEIATCSQTTICSTNIHGINSRFLFYCIYGLKDDWFRYDGSAIPQITVDQVKNNVLPLPSKQEQHSIASFLDTKCGEIDSLISLQEEMISELQAYKQSVITEAVTKGLDPNAKMKDSGVEWIGEIPENWKVSKVGLQYNVILGKMLCPKQLNDDYTLEKYYCAANVHFNGIEGELKKMWFSSLDKETYLTKKGDLLVVEGGAGAGGCAIVNDDESPVYIQNSIMIVRPKLINDVRYLRYQIEQFVKRGYIDVVCNKATIPHFTKDKVSNMQIPLPSFEVQQQIANYLDDKTSQIDSLISLKQQKIDELKDYKKSIIYEYVTGKKRV